MRSGSASSAPARPDAREHRPRGRARRWLHRRLGRRKTRCGRHPRDPHRPAEAPRAAHRRPAPGPAPRRRPGRGPPPRGPGCRGRERGRGGAAVRQGQRHRRGRSPARPPPPPRHPGGQPAERPAQPGAHPRRPARARVVPGMVSFNVVWGSSPAGGPRLQQATSGPIVLGTQAPPALVQALQAAGIETTTHADMPGVQWAKLILNLNNAVNALSGRSLRDELSTRGYRQVLAAAMNEAWAALGVANLHPQAIGKMRPRLAPRILPLPDLLFRLLAAPMIQIDPAARSSMADEPGARPPDGGGRHQRRGRRSGRTPRCCDPRERPPPAPREAGRAAGRATALGASGPVAESGLSLSTGTAGNAPRTSTSPVSSGARALLPRTAAPQR